MILQHPANHQMTIHCQHVDVNVTSSFTFVNSAAILRLHMIGGLHLQQNQLYS